MFWHHNIKYKWAIFWWFAALGELLSTSTGCVFSNIFFKLVKCAPGISATCTQRCDLEIACPHSGKVRYTLVLWVLSLILLIVFFFFFKVYLFISVLRVLAVSLNTHTGKKPPTLQEIRWSHRKAIPGLGRSPWRRAWQPTAVFLPGASHGHRSLHCGIFCCDLQTLSAPEHEFRSAGSSSCGVPDY